MARRHRRGLGELTKGAACDALAVAMGKNKRLRKLSNAQIERARDKCMAHWRKPPKHRMNPANKGCPVKTVTIRGKRGNVKATFKAHVCSKATRARRRRR